MILLLAICKAFVGVPRASPDHLDLCRWATNLVMQGMYCRLKLLGKGKGKRRVSFQLQLIQKPRAYFKTSRIDVTNLGNIKSIKNARRSIAYLSVDLSSAKVADSEHSCVGIATSKPNCTGDDTPKLITHDLIVIVVILFTIAIHLLVPFGLTNFKMCAVNTTNL